MVSWGRPPERGTPIPCQPSSSPPHPRAGTRPGHVCAPSPVAPSSPPPVPRSPSGWRCPTATPDRAARGRARARRRRCLRARVRRPPPRSSAAAPPSPPRPPPAPRPQAPPAPRRPRRSARPRPPSPREGRPPRRGGRPPRWRPRHRGSRSDGHPGRRADADLALLPRHRHHGHRRRAGRKCRRRGRARAGRRAPGDRPRLQPVPRRLRVADGARQRRETGRGQRAPLRGPLGGPRRGGAHGRRVDPTIGNAIAALGYDADLEEVLARPAAPAARARAGRGLPARAARSPHPLRPHPAVSASIWARPPRHSWPTGRPPGSPAPSGAAPW